MDYPTDTELRDRWESAERRLTAAKKLKDAKGIEEIKHEQEIIGREWNELFERKRQGNLTDTKACDLLEKIIKEEAVFRGVGVRVSRHEATRDIANIADHWQCGAATDVEYDLSHPDKLDGMATTITQAFIAAMPGLLLPFINREEPTTNPGDYFCVSPFIDMHSIRSYSNSDDEELPPDVYAIMWKVNAWVWEGPGGKFEKRDRSLRKDRPTR